MTNIKDDSCLDFVLEKMRNNILLKKEGTEEKDMQIYKNSCHKNYFIDNEKGFLCVSEIENIIFISYAWYDKTYKARKNMIKLGKELYTYYTENQKKNIYYTGKKNFYKHHSVEVSESIWILRL